MAEQRRADRTGQHGRDGGSRPTRSMALRLPARFSTFRSAASPFPARSFARSGSIKAAAATVNGTLGLLPHRKGERHRRGGERGG